MKRLLTLSTLALTIALVGTYVSLQVTSAPDPMAQQNPKKTKAIADPYAEWLQNKTDRKRAGHAKADEPEMHGIIQRKLRTRDGEDQPGYGPNQIMEEYLKAKERAAQSNARTSAFTFVERGPGNVGGRTRGLIVDPDDPNGNTFYAGAASGGIWKTTDAGTNWSYISNDIPNLGTNTLVMAPSNTNVIYAGTGEHFTNDIDGAGMFKSTDKGNTWTQIADPSVMPDFKNVSRIVVDPNDENTVIATTRSTVWGSFAAAIYKTTDGGTTWTRLRSSTSERYDDIDYDPTDFNTLYVAVRGRGVIKSTDGGTTWTDASKGLSPDGRVEITISPVNTDRLWASVVGSLSGSGSDLYVSDDGAATWKLAVDESGINEDFLGGQGWYDNIITAHPFDADKVYVGGVNTFLFSLTGAAAEDIAIIQPVEYGSEAFMSFVNFGGGYLGGGMELGGVNPDELLPIEIRFGEGTQMAHRFTVGGAGSGVPANNYIYEDYVEVPFQVWDTQNNQQLMVSFRDQQEDGAWNLIEILTDGNSAEHSREYLFIHNIAYADTPADTIAVNGGHEIGQMYFFWPVLTPDATFDPANLPVSQLAVEFQVTQSTTRQTTVVSDAYGQYNGVNNFFQQGSREFGLHPDQHNILTYALDPANQTFRLLIANDGGVYISVSDTLPGTTDGDFTFISYGYNTTQFYGADKAPGEDRYIGGMQDNGTWYNTPGTEGSASAEAKFAIGGDGFESLWHSADPDKIIGGSQFNNFARTTNGGLTWMSATNGFNDNGPFITRLANHKQLPDRLFTVGASGVWRSDDFAGSWSASNMIDSDLWSFTNSADVEVAYANPDIIWAGGIMNASNRLHVSTDGGQSFSATENYTAFEMGGVSGIGTHPTEDSTAFALFSFAGYPKVIKTTDLGQTWEDISGFDGTGAASSRGFPDVAVNCLFVFPNNTDQIWVGTEIGIVQSLDGGNTWSLLDSNLPPVNVYDFKLADDQLVIATYGRGIWSVTLDGIVIAPVVENVYVSPDGNLNFQFNFAEAFDSVQIIVNNEILGTVYDNSLGNVTTTLQNNGLNGNQNVRLDAYLDGQKYSSIETTIFVFTPNDAASSFGTNFIGAASEFIGDGFTVKLESGYDNIAMHSTHPYEDDAAYIFYLKTPIIVSASDATFSYRDIALVEPGSGGAVYGDPDFYDYVVVEASNDGLNWTALEDGYDASLYTDWLDAFNNGQSGSAGLFKEHSINLLDYFAAGEDILIRFRFYADDSNTGYGWVVDDLYIQEQPLGTRENAKPVLTLYPNPVRETATLRFEDQTPETIQIIQINGTVVETIKPAPGAKEISWNRRNLTGGIYIIRYRWEGKSYTHKMLIE